jgi:hypothetical protein
MGQWHPQMNAEIHLVESLEDVAKLEVEASRTRSRT